jgi:Zn-dependent protease with chaperone function
LAPSDPSSDADRGGGFGWPGRYSDGRVATLHRVRVRIVDDTLVIASDGGTIHEAWPLSDVRLIDEAATDNATRLGRTDSAARLTLNDDGARRLLELHCPALHAGMGGESSGRTIALWGGAAAAAIALLIFGVIPFIADHANLFISPRLDAQLGDQVASIITTITVASDDKKHTECDAPAGRAALDKLIAPLTAQVKLPNTLRVRVINTKMINAIALPGDQILVFRGLLDFAQCPNEVAGVIAHEIGHEVLDHPTRLVIQQSGTAFVIGLVLGDVFGGSALAIAGTTLIDTSFSRDAESAADAEALTLMAKAGFDTAPMGAFFERLDSKMKDIPIPFLRTHPANQARATLIEQAARGGATALDPTDWQDLKNICSVKPLK